MTDIGKRLRAKIAEQDAKRGRPLTATEKLDNLCKGLADDQVSEEEWQRRFGLVRDRAAPR